jgi:hypothetical protein
MENVVLQPVQQEYVDFMSLPMGVYKNIQYYNTMQGRAFFEANLCKKDGFTYYTHTTFKVKKSKNGYYRQNSQKYGFTLDQKGKLSVWYGKNIFEIPGIHAIFNHMNLNWFNVKLIPYVTKGIAEKMLTGKISNNTDLLKAYIKVMRLNCSPKLLHSVIEGGHYSKPLLLQMISVAKDQNHFLEFCLNEASSDEIRLNYFITDLVKQAQILGRQIDYMWSSKRMQEEHTKWTKEIMDVEVNDMKDVVSKTSVKFSEFKCDGFKLLTTKKEIYTEGKVMNHCIYTNYWSSVQNGNYLVYQVDWFGERATLGCYMSDEKITVNQCYRHSNRAISSGLTDLINTIFINSINRWAKENKIINQTLPY